METAPFVVASPDHPSLQPTIGPAVERFAAALRAEPRYFGRHPATGPKPAPSLIRRLIDAEPALRTVAVRDGDVLGMAALDLSAPGGAELLIAVAAPWRGQGVARELTRTLLERGRRHGVPRVVARTSKRVPALIALGRSIGCYVADVGLGRIELILTLVPISAPGADGESGLTG